MNACVTPPALSVTGFGLTANVTGGGGGGVPLPLIVISTVSLAPLGTEAVSVVISSVCVAGEVYVTLAPVVLEIVPEGEPRLQVIVSLEF